MKYLILTDQFGENKRINFDLVREYQRESNSKLTTITIVTPFSSNDVYVQETPEDIDWMLSKEGNVVAINVIVKPPSAGGGSGALAEEPENFADRLDAIDKVSAKHHESFNDVYA